MASALLAAATAALCLAALASAQDNLNTYSWMATYKGTGANCVATWNDLVLKYYTGANAACGDVVFKAMNTTVQADCPGGPPTKGSTQGGDRVGGELWNCMTGNGTNTALKDAWVSFVKGCEIFYVAYRYQGEQESGFKSKENSCLRKFDDLAAFKSYLNSVPSTQSGTGGGGGAGALTARVLAPLAAALTLAVGLAALL